MMPVIVGHKAISVVEILKPDTTRYSINISDIAVALLWHNMCLECVDCTSSGPEFCPKMDVKGLSTPGSFSEYTLVDLESAVVVRRAIDMSE